MSTFPEASAQRLTRMQQPKSQSFPAISGMAMAAAMYVSFVKGWTFVSQVWLSTYRLMLFMASVEAFDFRVDLIQRGQFFRQAL